MSPNVFHDHWGGLVTFGGDNSVVVAEAAVRIRMMTRRVIASTCSCSKSVIDYDDRLPVQRRTWSKEEASPLIKDFFFRAFFQVFFIISIGYRVYTKNKGYYYFSQSGTMDSILQGAAGGFRSSGQYSGGNSLEDKNKFKKNWHNSVLDDSSNISTSLLHSRQFQFHFVHTRWCTTCKLEVSTLFR